MKIELWIVGSETDDLLEDRIEGVTIVPPIGASMDTSDGIREVIRLHYDYADDGSSCRVHVEVARRAYLKQPERIAVNTIDSDAIETAYRVRQVKRQRLDAAQAGVLQLMAERKRLNLPYSLEFWQAAQQAARFKVNDIAQIDAMLEEAEAGLARCCEITERQKREAGK